MTGLATLIVCSSRSLAACEPLHMVGAETLNPHECRGTLRKCQEMRRTRRCALLHIIRLLENFARDET